MNVAAGETGVITQFARQMLEPWHDLTESLIGARKKRQEDEGQQSNWGNVGLAEAVWRSLYCVVIGEIHMKPFKNNLLTAALSFGSGLVSATAPNSAAASTLTFDSITFPEGRGDFLRGSGSVL